MTPVTRAFVDPEAPTSDDESLPPPRSLSVPAVLALVLGLVSVAAVFNPLAWSVAVAGAVLSWVGLRSIARADRVLLGRKAAYLGLTLSLLFLACGVARHYTRQVVLVRQAQQHADTWLELVRQGRLHAAHQLHLRQRQREAPLADLAKFYTDTREPRWQLKSFFEEQPLRIVVEQGARGRLTFVRSEGVAFDRMPGVLMDVIQLRYQLEYEDAGQPRTLPFIISVVRTIDPSEAEDAGWEIQSVKAPPRKA